MRSQDAASLLKKTFVAGILSAMIGRRKPSYLLACLRTCLLTYLLACFCLLTYLLTYRPTYLPTYIPTCLPACLPTYLLTAQKKRKFVPAEMHVSSSKYIYIFTEPGFAKVNFTATNHSCCCCCNILSFVAAPAQETGLCQASNPVILTASCHAPLTRAYREKLMDTCHLIAGVIRRQTGKIAGPGGATPQQMSLGALRQE